MKKLILATAAVMVVAGSASAADMAVKYRPEVKRCAADWWRGGYIGVNGGGVNYTANRTDQDSFLFNGTTVQQKWGWEVGGQIGYNWTTCNTVWGIEVDGQWARADVTTRFAPNGAFPGFTPDRTMNSRFDGLVTARARTGVVLDNLLLYVTGGVAAVHTRTTYHSAFTLSAPFVPGSFTADGDVSDWRWGFVAGFGSEWAWTDRISLKSEVLYIQTADREDRVNIVQNVGAPFFRNYTSSDSIWVSRVGINVKFGDYPVAAKY
jgi:outer membrane immunogenic protein